MANKKILQTTLLQQAKKQVPGFASAYVKFHERITIDQNSKSMINNYSRCIAAVALHFNSPPQEISVERINTYLYGITEHEKRSLSYFKQSIYGLRHWFRLFGMEEKAIQMPSVRDNETLPTVLSRQECRLIFKAPRSLKHRFMLAFAYAAGLRMNELRLLKIADVDVDRRQVHVRLGKRRKDRYVILSDILAHKLPLYLAHAKPKVYLFEGQTPAQPMGERSIQFVIAAAMKRTQIKKHVSMHTLRHSYATHLLEDGVDIYSIQKQLGHSDIRTTIIYLHVADLEPRQAHSPLDTLYGVRS